MTDYREEDTVQTRSGTVILFSILGFLSGLFALFAGLFVIGPGSSAPPVWLTVLAFTPGLLSIGLAILAVVKMDNGQTGLARLCSICSAGILPLAILILNVVGP